jgi:hypothetical protein
MTCHGGRLRPSRLPQDALKEQQANWPSALSHAGQQTRLAMAVYNVTLGVGCEYCHVPLDWRSDVKPPFRMVAVMAALFDTFPKYMPPSARTQCWMCHKGSTDPRR